MKSANPYKNPKEICLTTLPYPNFYLLLSYFRLICELSLEEVELYFFSIRNMEKYQEYLIRLERELKYRNYSPKTVKAYVSCVRYFLEKIDKTPEDIDKEEIIDYVLFLQSQKKAPKTINLYKESIKFFYKEILRQEKNIDIKLSREAKKLPVVLTKTEIKLIIENIKNEKHKFIIALAY